MDLPSMPKGLAPGESKMLSGDSRDDVVELLLPAVSGRHPQLADRRFSLTCCATFPAPGHRSRVVWDFVQQQKGRLWLEVLPNPVEYLWFTGNSTSCLTSAPITFGQLSHYARKALRRMHRRLTLVIAFR